MFHLLLHIMVPLVLAFLFYRPRWIMVFVILIATMVVDVDHLFATPIYDPARCSIGFHPLHTWPAIVIYGMMFILPFFFKSDGEEGVLITKRKGIQLIGLGLLIHMALDTLDCFI